MSFKKGEVIILRRQIDTYWFHGETGGNQGAFPITYAKVYFIVQFFVYILCVHFVHYFIIFIKQIIVPLPPPYPQCTALYDFHMAAPDEEGCLAFNKGSNFFYIRA